MKAKTGASEGNSETAVSETRRKGQRKSQRKRTNHPNGASAGGNGRGRKANGAALEDELSLQELFLALDALERGDFTVELPRHLTGIEGKVAESFNHVVALNHRLAQELERVSQVVGREGRISRRASAQNMTGAWATQVASVNALIDDLVYPTRETARVIGAVAKGDLSQSMALDIEGRPLAGEFLRTARVVNTMVDQLASFASEVTRVAREVGTEGKLGGQARVKGVAGTWKDLTDSVNSMARNLTSQVRNIAAVTTAVAKGDLSKKITVDVKGELRELKDTINTMVDQLSSFASEVTRVAREVGTEGELGGQAEVRGVAGTWKDLTDSVNSMARNLTSQVRNIAAVTTAVANGDLSKKITVDVKGEMLELKDTINTMVDQLNSFASEVTRVAREVGTEGKLGGQAEVKGAAGTWKDLTDNVNSMGGNLTSQVRNIAAVTTAVAKGDLSKKITVDVKGEMLELKDTINTMVDQLNSFASEVTRVAREVGTEGKLGGQAEVKGVAGTWKDLTDSVNSMAGNLTSQVRNIAAVTTAVANGDLSKKITVEVKGEILELKNTINTMVDQLSSFASEVTRVAREVGTEGKLGGQAEVKGVAGTWKDLTDNVNSMAGNLTDQVRNIAGVTTAVAKGDLSKKITVHVKGEILELKDTINTMVDQLNSFASEVTRVAREVGTEGKLGGQAEVKGVAGTWKDLTDSVNSMAGNLTSQVRNIAAVTTAVAKGDLSKKITVDVRGEILELKDTINTMVDQLNSFASEVTRVAREVGTEGKLGGQAEVKGVAGTWKDLTDSVNSMAGNLTSQVRNIAGVTTAVATGDLSKKITVDVKGEMLELKDTINTMVDQLNSFASEVTRVAREVGTEGKLGGQAEVKGVAGTWKDLTDNVNSMAGNLTNQVRGIAKVVTAVANGDLDRKLLLEAKGEIAELADTINSMIDTLATFADQVTGVAREVGVEGKLGGQASVPGAAGTWKGLTDNVNQLAANLTSQVRAIADVATAVTRGDLTRSIDVAAEGEVAALKDNINAMIQNLRETTRKNAEQDWLKTNLAKFSRMLQGQKELLSVGRLILSELAPVVNAQHGVFYILDNEDEDEPRLKLLASYAYKERKTIDTSFKLGEGLVGQCALEKEKILLRQVPGDYIRISSGLGEAPPLNVIVIPVIFEGQVKAVLELASFERLSETHQSFLEQFAESIGIVINTIEASTLTENLLTQSQTLANELQNRQSELQTTNAELEEKAKLLAEQNVEVERKNREVEQARQALEEKAEQLALTSRYKSEFLANMSHELRTPLNSLLILSDHLCRNPENNLSERQVEYARTIHSSGNDLLFLINDILDLSKIESGTVMVDVGEIKLRDLIEYVERTFRPVAEKKGLGFELSVSPDVPGVIHTDAKRIQQVLKNLLSNAFKFTERGQVSLRCKRADRGWTPGNPRLDQAHSVVAFTVVDTGVGIPPEKQQLVFEAFQQADGSSSRNYGGTGLGLAISREIALLLGGELTLESEIGAGSSFTLYIPQSFAPLEETSPSRTAEPIAPDTYVGSDSGSGSGSGSGGDGFGDPVDAPPVAVSSLTVDLVSDDSKTLKPGDKVVLIVESRLELARRFLDLSHGIGLKAVVVPRGEAAIAAARKYQPAVIALDVNLPDMDGFRILELVKDDLALRHIPVFVLTSEDETRRALWMAADGVSTADLRSPPAADALFKEIERCLHRTSSAVALVESDEETRGSVVELLEGSDTELSVYDSAGDAVGLTDENLDLLVVGREHLRLGGLELIEGIAQKRPASGVRVLVYGPDGGNLDDARTSELLARYPRLVLLDVRSQERLLQLTSLFLHRRFDSLPESQRHTLQLLKDNRPGLVGRTVLIVDDDIRNIFAMTSLLERYQMKVLSEETARGAIETLKSGAPVEVVLLDIMMPDIDGYDAIRMIRQTEKFRSLPIIALTARAMKGDREKCIAAGASDYVAKPVDSDHLLSVLHTWLFR